MSILYQSPNLNIGVAFSIWDMYAWKSIEFFRISTLAIIFEAVANAV